MCLSCSALHAFVRFLKAAVRKSVKICLILDNTPQHYARMMCQLVEMIEGLTPKLLLVATPEISTIEIYWNSLGRKMSDASYVNPNMLHKAITGYAGHTKPRPNAEKILHRAI